MQSYIPWLKEGRDDKKSELILGSEGLNLATDKVSYVCAHVKYEQCINDEDAMCASLLRSLLNERIFSDGVFEGSWDRVTVNSLREKG